MILLIYLHPGGFAHGYSTVKGLRAFQLLLDLFLLYSGTTSHPTTIFVPQVSSVPVLGPSCFLNINFCIYR